MLLTKSQFDDIRNATDYDSYLKSIQSEKNITLEQITHAIYTVMSDRLPYNWMAVSMRTTEIMYARHYGRYIAYTYTNYQTADVCRYFGGKRFSAIYNTLKKVKAIENSPGTDKRFIELKEILSLIGQQGQ
jgi:chromosomal replication initiation ATPase DnaA